VRNTDDVLVVYREEIYLAWLNDLLVLSNSTWLCYLQCSLFVLVCNIYCNIITSFFL